MRWSLLLACVALIAFGASFTDATRPFSVVAYLPEWRYEGANFDTILQHCSHLLFFSLEVSAKGGIRALDRLPRPELLAEARQAAQKHGSELLICFGGNGRSSGFSGMVRDDKARAKFIENLIKLCDRHGFNGVDYNWEYPGFVFGSGYQSEDDIEADYQGLEKLLADTRAAFDAAAAKAPAGSIGARRRLITLAYYPDGKQEQLLAPMQRYVDMMHMMTYDQTSGHHSSFEFAERSAKQGAKTLEPARLTLGLPFYGRNAATGDWMSYEDLVQKQHPLKATLDDITTDDGTKLTFNGQTTIWAKTRLAAERLQLGGVMIWEVGQDCRMVAVTHGDRTHVRTCPTDQSSLMVAITRGLQDSNVARYRAEGWVDTVEQLPVHDEL